MSDRYASRALRWDGALIAFLGVHVAALGVFATGMSWGMAALAVALYVVRMFAITAGYHRYFAHRAYSTSRAFQFLLAFVAQTSLQSGAVWWAAKHRDHHRYSDTGRDSHSPRQYGFWFSHCGWIFHDAGGKADYSRVPDLQRFPELMWLDRQRFMPGILLGFACWCVGGWAALTAFLVSTVVLYHCTFFINSLAHVYGRQRYLTGDDSRNNWWLAILTLGEGWHNNHHYFMASTRQGFYWWEVDFTYYALRGLQAFGLVWDLKTPPAHVLAGQRSLSDELKERVAAHLAGSFPVEKIVARLRQRWQDASWDDFVQRAEARLEIVRAELPSFDELKRRANRMFARSPAMDEIIERAHRLLEQSVLAHPQLQPVPVRN